MRVIKCWFSWIWLLENNEEKRFLELDTWIYWKKKRTEFCAYSSGIQIEFSQCVIAKYCFLHVDLAFQQSKLFERVCVRALHNKNPRLLFFVVWFSVMWEKSSFPLNIKSLDQQKCDERMHGTNSFYRCFYVYYGSAHASILFDESDRLLIAAERAEFYGRQSTKNKQQQKTLWLEQNSHPHHFHQMTQPLINFHSNSDN